jgi:hypothetical protein
VIVLELIGLGYLFFAALSLLGVWRESRANNTPITAARLSEQLGHGSLFLAVLLLVVAGALAMDLLFGGVATAFVWLWRLL